MSQERSRVWAIFRFLAAGSATFAALGAWEALAPFGGRLPLLVVAGALLAWKRPLLPERPAPFLFLLLLLSAATLFARPLLGAGTAPWAAGPALALLAGMALSSLAALFPRGNPKEHLPWNLGAWSAILCAGLLAGRLAPELHTLDPGSAWWAEGVWLLLAALPLLGFLLLSLVRPGRAPGYLLAALFPLGLARTLSGFGHLAFTRDAVKMVNALALLPGVSTEGPPPLDPLAGTLWAVYPPPGLLLLFQASLAALPLLLLGGAAAALGGRENPRPGPAAWAGLFALGAWAGPLLGPRLLAGLVPLLALAALLIPDPAAPSRGPALPGRLRALLGLLLAGAAGGGIFLLPSPPPLAAPLAMAGFTAKEVSRGRLGLAPPPGISFLDGLPLRRPGGQLFLLEDLPGASGESLCLGPPNFRMPPPWTTRSLMEEESLDEALRGGPWEEILLALPCPDHRGTGNFLTRNALRRISSGCRRLYVALDLGSLEGKRIPILAKRCLDTGKRVSFFLALGGLTPPLLVARLGPGRAERPACLHRAAGPERVRALAALAGPSFLEPWTFRPPWNPEPHHGRVREALLLLAREDLPGKGPRPGVRALMRALATRWRTPPPPDTVGHDPDRALVPSEEELRALTEGIQEDPAPVLLHYAEMVGDHLLKPSIQRLGEARPFFEEWERTRPENPTFARLLGTLHVRLLEYEQALPLLEKAWRLKKGDPRILRELGLALFGLKRYRAAASRLKALSPDPARDLEAARALGLSLFHLKDPAAKTWIAKVHALDPWDKETEKAAKALGLK